MNAKYRSRAGLTLIELMVVVAVLAVLVAVAAPSVRKLLEIQRMRGISAQLTTDIQFVRAEAASRQEFAGISFRYEATTQSCYTVHTCGSAALNACNCDCTQGPGSSCPTGGADPPREIKTVSVPVSRGVIVGPTNEFGLALVNGNIVFDPDTGAMASFYNIGFAGPQPPPPGDFLAATRLMAPSAATGVIRTEVSVIGRPRTCDGYPAACP